MGLIERGVLFQLFWIPAVVSVGLLIQLWFEGVLRKSAPLLAAWCLVAAVLQFSATTPGTWVSGLTLQAALAVGLLIKYRLERV